MKNIDVVAKQFDRKYLKENNHIVFKNRELIIERETSDDPESGDMFRFKIGDGITPYRNLKYTSTIYALFPNVCLYDSNYETCVSISLGGDT